jgi:hypothetical protein
MAKQRMAEDRYNVVFSGELLSGADGARVREKLGACFRLDSTQLDNLFSGQTVVVKHDVDLLTATRFQQAFLAAGARAEIEAAIKAAPHAGAPDPTPGADTGPNAEPTPGRAPQQPADRALSLAPLGTPLEEIDDRGPPRRPDTSALSLLPADGWDLSDCAPLPAAIPELDLAGLALVPLDARRPDDGQ